jgi:DNA polymerase III delta prime subunit
MILNSEIQVYTNLYIMAATPYFESSTPWVEKYRPKTFDNIVLDKTNQVIFKNIIEKGYFPNLLLYGPPGTGKTTTVINLVNAFQKKYTKPSPTSDTEPATIAQPTLGLGTVIHLNASDERGIDVIRSQISTFVNTKSLFGRGCQLKFIILDEVDYMTKNAQQALRYLINNYNKESACNVKFCLICNYVSKIDESLQSEFVKMRFNQLPETCIIDFLNQINVAEKLHLSDTTLRNIQTFFGSDIRGMINYMQSNQSASESACKIIHPGIWTELVELKTASELSFRLNQVSKEYNIEKKSMILQFLNYIIRTRQTDVTPELLTQVEHAIHNQEYNSNHVVEYISLVIMKWKSLLKC